MTKGNLKGLRWRVRRHMRHANQHRPRSFCCYVIDVWIRGKWQQCMGGSRTGREARREARRWYGLEVR